MMSDPIYENMKDEARFLNESERERFWMNQACRLSSQVNTRNAQLKEVDALTDELTKGIGAASCINPLTDMRNAIAKIRNILFKPFVKTNTLDMLYEAWNRLPACELMAVISAAIQDIQYYREELVRMRERHALETAQMRNQVEHLTKALTEAVSLQTPIIHIERKN